METERITHEEAAVEGQMRAWSEAQETSRLLSGAMACLLEDISTPDYLAAARDIARGS